MTPGTRAVTRTVQSGSYVLCSECEEQVKFEARKHNLTVICNVYQDGVWNRVEHFHPDCYDEANHPYGPPITT